jgi:hypothetical protein
MSSPFALGRVNAPRLQQPITPKLHTSAMMPEWDARTILDSPAAQAAEPWSRTTADRNKYMAQAFRGYDPQGSNFTGTDPEGRAINSPFHAGTVQGQNTPLSVPNTENVAHVLSTLSVPQKHFMSMYRVVPEVGDAAGMTRYSHSKSEAPLAIEAYQPEGGPWRQTPRELEHTKRHEMAHGLARRGYEGADYQSIPAMLAAASRMGTPFAGNVNMALQQMRNDPQIENRHLNIGHTDKMKQYINSDPEIFAENVEMYLRDPNDYKTRNPEAAAALRAIVNNNPKLNKYLTLSQVLSSQVG